MQDNPPRNRKQRRAVQFGHKAPAATLVRPQPRPASPSAPPDPATGIGAPSVADASDSAQSEAPTFERKASHKAGGGKQQRIYETLVSYYALAGLAVARVDKTDGAIIMQSAEKCAEAWIAAGKGDSRIMRALELVTTAGPYTALIMIHAQLALTIMDRHDANPFAGLMARTAAGVAPVSVPAAPGHHSGQQGAPAPLPYVPAGPNAPTEAPDGPPPYAGEAMVIPDEGLPAEIDIALRELSRTSGRPYHELRQEALVELAQMRMAQNGHRVVTPGALGAPITRE